MTWPPKGKNRRAKSGKENRAAKNEPAIHDADEHGRGKPSKERPWCWCEESPLDMITETFSESNQAASARSVYLALSQLSSDERSDSFTATKALIAQALPLADHFTISEFAPLRSKQRRRQRQLALNNTQPQLTTKLNEKQNHDQKPSVPKQVVEGSRLVTRGRARHHP